MLNLRASGNEVTFLYSQAVKAGSRITLRTFLAVVTAMLSDGLRNSTLTFAK